MKKFTLVCATAALSATAALVPAPANATVHEIIGRWCSPAGVSAPPGISGGSHADNFAQPLFASGFIGDVVPFDPPGDQPAGLLITFNFDNPNVKVVGLGTYTAIDDTPAGPLYIQDITPDPEFAAFMHCPALAG